MKPYAPRNPSVDEEGRRRGNKKREERTEREMEKGR
jgi:hypothetical protein